MITQSTVPGPPGFFIWCRVCGGPGSTRDRAKPEDSRCWRHLARNPCAIEGCTRSTAADGRELALDQWLCSIHWRAFVPPRSRRRRAYHAFFRKAKKYGWTADLRRRFWRYWRFLIASSRRRATGGNIDVTEINKFMGWE
jgi:hypothetical protein